MLFVSYSIQILKLVKDKSDYDNISELPSWYMNKSSTNAKNSRLEEFKRYRLRNSLGYEVDVLSLGATITAIKVNLIENYCSKAEYISHDL